MPLYRDDQGTIYHSHRADLTGEADRPGPTRMPDDAWLRVARVQPAWVERLPHAALALVALSVLLLASLLPLWLLVGPVAAGVGLFGLWLILNIGYFPLLAMAGKPVAMNRPLRLITPQPGGLIVLELLRPRGGLVPLVGLMVMLRERPVMMEMVPGLLVVLGVMAVVILGINIRFIRGLRRGAVGVTLVG